MAVDHEGHRWTFAQPVKEVTAVDMDAVVLTPDDLREIDGATSQFTVKGARYPEQLRILTGR